MTHHTNDLTHFHTNNFITPPGHLTFLAYSVLVSSSHTRPPARVYGKYWVKKRATWQPGGARVGSQLLGRVISIMGLKTRGTVYPFRYNIVFT